METATLRFCRLLSASEVPVPRTRGAARLGLPGNWPRDYAWREQHRAPVIRLRRTQAVPRPVTRTCPTPRNAGSGLAPITDADVPASILLRIVCLLRPPGTGQRAVRAAMFCVFCGCLCVASITRPRPVLSMRTLTRAFITYASHVW